MTSDDQYFLDLLSSIPRDAARYGNAVADFIDRQVDTLATEVKQWTDKINTPFSSSRAPSPIYQAPPPPKSFVQKTADWVSEHRVLVAVTVAFTGTTLLLIHNKRKNERRKRRAKRTVTGAKKEVVVLASTIHDPLARSLAFDLERRGYIIYITVSSQAEYDLVARGSDARPDIRPLWMDLTSSVPNPEKDIHPALTPIHDLIAKPQVARSNGIPSQQYMCSLAGLILMPATDYIKAPLLSVPAHDLIDIVNTRLLSPMLLTQQFLPLLSNLTHPTSIIVAYPSIPDSLTPPLQVTASAATSALSSFTQSLRSEIQLLQPPHSQPIQVTELKLGNIDLGTTPSFSKAQNARDLEALSRSASSSPPPRGSPNAAPQQALTWHWHSTQRAQALRRTFGQTTTSVRGSPVRTFHNAVFDTLYAGRSLKPASTHTWPQWLLGLAFRITDDGPGGVVYAGRGARLYDYLSRNVHPRSLVDIIVRWRYKRDGYGYQNEHTADIERGGNNTHHQNKDHVMGPASGSPGLEGSYGSESAVWEKV